MASACRAVAAALVKSFPPAVAAPFCMLVDGDLLRQHAEFRGVDRRKTFQESPRKVSGRRQRPGASPCLAVPRRGAAARLARALLKSFPPTDAEISCMLVKHHVPNQCAEGRGDGWGKTFHQGRRRSAAGARHGTEKNFFLLDTFRHNDNN